MPDGEAALDRAVGAATIVAALKLDPDSIVAALLIGLPAADAFDGEDIAARFGADVATLVAGVARMSSIRAQASVGIAGSGTRCRPSRCGWPPRRREPPSCSRSSSW